MNLANRITLTRIFFVPVFIALLLYYSPERAFLLVCAAGVFLFACITDALDGFLARKLNQKTRLGSYIDPIADKLLLLSGFVSLSFMTHLPEAMRVPAWVTISVVSRDVVIVIGAIIVFFTTGTLKPEPNFIGKVTTVVQMGALFSALVMAPETLRFSLFAAAVFFTILSGVLYVRMGGKMIQEP